MTYNAEVIHRLFFLPRKMLALAFVVPTFWATTLAMAQDCMPPSISPYSGPLFDAMAQTGQYLDGEAAITTAKSVGVTRMALFARVHKREDGRSLVNDMVAKHPEFITLGAPKFFDMRGDLDSLYVHDVLNGVAAKRYAFVGEILYTHGDKTGGETTTTGERYIDPTRPETERLVQGLRGMHIPIMTHWEVYNWSRELQRFNSLYAAHPDQLFVWPHLGFSTPQQAETVLGPHPNVWATLSKKEKSQENLADEDKAEQIGGAVTDECGNLLPEWREVMLRFSGRLMFATDAHQKNRWSNYAHIVLRWRMILAQLPPNVASAIAYDNAVRLYSHAGTN